MKTKLHSALPVLLATAVLLFGSTSSVMGEVHVPRSHMTHGPLQTITKQMAMQTDLSFPRPRLLAVAAAAIVATIVVAATTPTSEIIIATFITNITTETVTTTATGIGGDPVEGGLESGVISVSPGRAAQLAKATFD